MQKYILFFRHCILLGLLCCLHFPALALAGSQAKDNKDRTLPLTPWTGDLDGMIARRQIRVLVSYSKTSFFVDKGVQRGINYDAFQEFEEQFNRNQHSKQLRVDVVFIPVARDQLLPALLEGRGDVAAANLTITGERQALVDFTEPILNDVREIVLTGPQSAPLATVDDLAGREVFVRKSSSYYASLTALNALFKTQGKAEIIFQEAPENFDDEDMMEMLQAGLVEILVMDDHKARFWKQIFPKLTLHEDIVLRQGGDIGWAIRKNSPQLMAELNAFIKTHRKGTTFGNIVFQRYLQSTRYVKSATDPKELKKFRELLHYFRQYGDQYAMDWILMAAQGYQESGLDQNAKSKVGAIGIMQVMPKTGKELNVGDIRRTEPNIHAGIKYIRFMIDQHYKDEPMDALNKGLFAFASYNAGPARIRSLRKEAGDRGLDPNVWFNNVELVAAERIGRETVTYVSNIFKYYIAYTMTQKQYLARKQSKNQQKTAQ